MDPGIGLPGFKSIAVANSVILDTFLNYPMPQFKMGITLLSPL